MNSILMIIRFICIMCTLSKYHIRHLLTFNKSTCIYIYEIYAEWYAPLFVYLYYLECSKISNYLVTSYQLFLKHLNDNIIEYISNNRI